MRSRRCFLGLLAVVCAGVPAPVLTADPTEESIVLDPATGDYTLTYCCDDDGSIAVDVFEPSTKIEPGIASSLKQLKDGLIQYRFRISISAASRQPLGMFLFDPVSSVPGSGALGSQGYNMPVDQIDGLEQAAREKLSTPKEWDGSVVPNRDGALRVGWTRLVRLEEQYGEFLPGHSQGGFGFDSADLPGVGMAQFMGKTSELRGYSGEGPDPETEVGKAVRRLEENDFVLRHAAIPTIAVSSPFECGSTLERIRDHIKPWPAQQMMEAGLNARVIGLLDNAMASCGSGPGNSSANAIKALNEIRTELRKRFPGLEAEGGGHAKNETLAEHDQRLAVRVLDFNVTYVKDRLTGK